MRELLVVVLELGPTQVRADLAEVDRPGELVREAVVERGPDLLADVHAALSDLGADRLALRLLALAVAVAPVVAPDDVAGLLGALTGGGAELVPGWALPAQLPVLAGAAADWEALAAGLVRRPLVAGAAVAAARSVGAHAHLPHP